MNTRGSSEEKFNWERIGEIECKKFEHIGEIRPNYFDGQIMGLIRLGTGEQSMTKRTLGSDIKWSRTVKRERTKEEAVK